MSSIPKELHYTKDHEWVRQSTDPQIVEVGITDYAQGELGDVVFVELPKASVQFKQRDVFGTIEAVKAVSELYSLSPARSSKPTRRSRAIRRS